VSANPSPRGEPPVHEPPVAPGYDGIPGPYDGAGEPYGAPGPSAPPPRGDWRTAVATASGLNAIAGIWLIIAPFVLNYRTGDPYWNDIVFGAAVLVMGGIRAFGAYRESWLSWLNALIGAWIFVSAFWLDRSARASWNDVILGVIVVVLALLSATASEDAAARDWYRR
jgi:hypothetical protein